MTTIAVKDGIMASDSAQISYYINPIEFKKMFKIGGSVIGASGDSAHILIFIEWFKNGCDSDKWPSCLGGDSNLSALVLRPDGSVDGFFDVPVAVPMGKIAAIGSGLEFAMGAMYSGKSAKEAVEVAARLDQNTIKPIKVYRVKINP